MSGSFAVDSNREWYSAGYAETKVAIRLSASKHISAQASSWNLELYPTPHVHHEPQKILVYMRASRFQPENLKVLVE